MGFPCLYGYRCLAIPSNTHSRTILKAASHKTSFGDYESEKIYGAYDWSDPYVDEQAYYGAWSREEVKNELADAYE